MKLRVVLLSLALCPLLMVGCSNERALHTFDKQQLTDQFYGEGAAAGDFNNDGILDVVSGPFWYEGPDYQTAHAYYTPQVFDVEKYSDHFFPYSVDFNSDGWDDIFLLGFPGEAALWFENPGDADSLWTSYSVFPQVGGEAPTWADLTGDGKPEIVCVFEQRFGYVTPDWDDLTQPWTFHPITPEGEWGKYTHGLGLGDVNGDGRLDLLEAAGWWEQPASLDGDPEWIHHAADFGEGGAQMYAYDFDGDGDNDILTSLKAHEWGLAWFEQVSTNGTTTFNKHLIMGETPAENRYGVAFSQVHGVALVDMDGDGLDDIVTGKRYLAHGTWGDPDNDADPVLYWFKTVRTADGVDFLPYEIDNDSGIGVGVTVSDVNEDGRPDIVIGNKNGAYVFTQRVDQVDAQAWAAAQPQVYGGS